jgi:DNA-binding response OmpR family regulator
MTTLLNGRSGPLHVLLVEDDAELRDYLQRTLERNGWQVDAAADGQEALELFGRRRPDLAVVDLMLPGIDGITLIAAIRADLNGETLPILVVTAKDLTPEECEQLNRSVEQVLRKGSFRSDDLLRSAQALVEAHNPHSERNGRSGMARILVVEDDPPIREMVTTYLTLSGFEVITAVAGVQALLLVRNANPDVILMDMGLPRLSGWQTIQRLRARQDTAQIPIIALTAYVLEDERNRAIGAGCDAFEAKPIDFPSLVSNINSLLARSSAPAPKV